MNFGLVLVAYKNLKVLSSSNASPLFSLLLLLSSKITLPDQVLLETSDFQGTR